MSIPEIDERSYELIRALCCDPSMSTFAQYSIAPEDPITMQVQNKQADEDIQFLCSLGFLKDITEEHREQIDKHNEETKRNWKIYEVTAMARAMFQAYTSPSKN